MLGDSLLVVPATKKSQKQIEVYLPDGNWFDYYSYKKMGTGE